MKKVIIPIICVILLALAFYKSNAISTLIANKVTSSPNLAIPEKNEYAKNKSYQFVQLTDSFIPYSYQDLKNIFYTTINNGWESFTFYCPSEYKECLNDAENLRNDKLTLTYINDFVHPYNSFASLKTSVASNGEIIITPNYLYTEEQIIKIENKIDEIINNADVLKKSAATKKRNYSLFS